MAVKNASKFVKKTSIFFGSLFALIYVFLFIPALMFIPLLGVFVLDANGMTTTGTIFSILGLATIPLSMPFSIYLIYARCINGHYGKMWFFCFLPLFCCIFALLFIHSIIYFHDYLFNPGVLLFKQAQI